MDKRFLNIYYDEEIMNNYPKLGSGTKYYEKTDVYVDASGFKFCLEDQLTISEFKEII